MSSAHNEGKSVIAERFIKVLKSKITLSLKYKKMTVNDNKSDLPYLNKLVNQYNNAYHHFVNKKLINADFLLCLKKLKPILKLLSLKSMIELELLSIKYF